MLDLIPLWNIFMENESAILEMQNPSKLFSQIACLKIEIGQLLSTERLLCAPHIVIHVLICYILVNPSPLLTPPPRNVHVSLILLLIVLCIKYNYRLREATITNS